MIRDAWDGLAAPAVERLAGADLRLVLLALVLHVINVVLRSTAWRNVLAAAYPDERVPVARVGCAFAAGMALNAVIPARGGDAVKVALARQLVPGAHVPCVAATLAVTGIFDALAGSAAVLAAVATGALPGLPPLPELPWGLAALVLAVAAAACALVGRRLRARVRALRAELSRGGAILRRPGRYLALVAGPQALGWSCRIAIVLSLLHAFGIAAGVEQALLVIVLGGLSTAAPTPGGAGAQQVAAVYALSGTAASAAAALSFSISMQVGVTLVNTLLGVLGAMAIFRTLRPVQAIRAARRAHAGDLTA